MKKIIVLLNLLSFSVFVYSQSLVLLDDNHNVVSHSVVDVFITPSSSTTTQILINNSSMNGKTYKVRRNIITIDASDQTQFCFGGLCYSPTLNLSNLSLYINSHDTVNFVHNGFHAVMNAGPTTIMKMVRYTFFDTLNLNDTMDVTLKYFTTLGINETTEANQIISDAYPNPSSSFVSVNYTITGNPQKAKLVLYNLIGKEIKQITLNDKQGIAKLNTEDLPAGIYFYSLIIDENMVSTKKIVVCH